MLFHLYLLGKVSKKKLLGTARVIAYGTVVAMGFGALTVHSALADAGTQSLELGRKLADLQDLLHGAQEFRLNGQRVYFSATKTDESLDKVLDRFENHCNNSRAFSALDWKSLASVKGKDLPDLKQNGVSRFGVLRREDPIAGDGVVMCFTKETGPRDALQALEAFENSGDLHDVGDVRYVHAVRKDGQTLVQTMWTDGTFNLRTLMGTPGHDAVGSDFATLPRPIDSTRIMTADAPGTPYAARIYESPDAPGAILKAYTEKMAADGWSSITSPDVGMDKNGIDGRYFVRPQTAEQAVVSVSKQDGKTVTVVASVGVLPSTKNLHPEAQSQ